MRGLLFGIAAVLLAGTGTTALARDAADAGSSIVDTYIEEAGFESCLQDQDDGPTDFRGRDALIGAISFGQPFARGRFDPVHLRLCAARAYSADGSRDSTLAMYLLDVLARAEIAGHPARPLLAIETADLLIEQGDRLTALQLLDRHIDASADPVLQARADIYRLAAEMLPYPGPAQLADLEGRLDALGKPRNEATREALMAGWRIAGFAYLAVDEAEGAQRAFARLAELTEGGNFYSQRYAIVAWREQARLAYERGDLDAALELVERANFGESWIDPNGELIETENYDGVVLLRTQIELARGGTTTQLFPGTPVGDPENEFRPRADWNLDFDGETQERREQVLTLYRRIYEERGLSDLTSAPVIPDLPQLLTLAFEQAQSLSTSAADDAASYANALRQVDTEEERARLEQFDRVRTRYRQALRRYATLGDDASPEAVADLLADLARDGELMLDESEYSSIYEDYPGSPGRYDGINSWYLGFRQWDDVGQREDMLLIVPADGDIHVFAQGWTGETGFAWHVVEDGEAIIAPLVERLRCQVDYGSCTFEAGAALSAIPLSPLQEADQLAYDRQAAYELYRLLIEPVEPALTPGSDVFVMARGAMSTLPLAMLVTEAPEEGYDWADYAAMRDASWLGDRYAFTTTPSFLSFRPNRLMPITNVSQDMLFAVADPAFQGEAQPGELRSADLLLMTREGRLANVAAIRTLAALPGTRKEYESMRSALSPPTEVALLGADATEEALRSHPALPDARFVLLATHGLLPRQNDRGIIEPSLVFTPPEEPTQANDGLLTASEVRDLTLRAEWVFLSACNTAAAGGSGDSLSELASAFLRAGALQVLASHWPVLDEVTPVLTTATIRASAENRRGGPGRALQSAISSVRNGQTPDGTPIEGWQESWAHPLAWAPFVLISNGDEAIVNQRFDTDWN